MKNREIYRHWLNKRSISQQLIKNREKYRSLIQANRPANFTAQLVIPTYAIYNIFRPYKQCWKRLHSCLITWRHQFEWIFISFVHITSSIWMDLHFFYSYDVIDLLGLHFFYPHDVIDLMGLLLSTWHHRFEWIFISFIQMTSSIWMGIYFFTWSLIAYVLGNISFL